MGHPSIINPCATLTDFNGTGKGMRAVTDIKAGTLLVAEQPLFPSPDAETYDNFEEHLQMELNKLDEDNRRAYFDLRNSWAGKMPRLRGIWATNAMPVNGDAAGIFPICSRYNHNCTSSATYSWNNEMGLQLIYATKDIPAGQEVCVGYFGREMMKLPTYERQQLTYQEMRFVCLCATCGNTDLEVSLASDQRRIDIGRLIEKLKKREEGSLADAARYLQDCRDVLQLLLQEGASPTELSPIYFMAFRVCAENSDLARASAFAKLSAKMLRLWAGSANNTLAEITGFIEEPDTYLHAEKYEVWTTEVKDAMNEDSEGFEEWLWSRAR